MNGVAASVPRVLVLMTTRNGEPWLAEQMASIFGQVGVEVVVRVSDDRSTDGTVALLQRLALTRPNLHVKVREVGSGSAGANFKGLLATSDFAGFDAVALADQDDVWLPDHLLRGCTALADQPAAGGYSCAVRTFGAGKPAVHAQDPRIRRLDYLFEGAGQGCTFVFTAALARRVQRACRDFPAQTAELHYHDWMVYLVARRTGLGWVFDRTASLNYRQHGANEIGARSGRGSMSRRVKLIRNGWFRRQVGAALALAQVLAPGNKELQSFARVFATKRSMVRSTRLAWTLLRDGRRRLSDRLILGASALAGWI